MLCVGYAAESRAHHSVVNYDLTQTLELDGVVKQWSETNPHAYLTLTVSTAQGSSTQWRCESYAVASLMRLGITPITFQPGQVVHVTASPSRIDPTACLIESVRGPDGQLFSLRAPRQNDNPVLAQQLRDASSRQR